MSSCILSSQSYRDFYTPKERLHNGNSSMLYSVVRKDSDKEFCMKCIPYVNKIFASREEDVKSLTQVLNEIQIMQANKNEHIINFKESYIDEVKQKVFVIMELMDDNMTNLIESTDHISEDICKYILYSVLKGI